MKFGIINLNIVPLRLKDDAKSEMISQLFFGEILTIIDKTEKWSFVESNLDKYRGWIRNLHFKSITKNQSDKIESQRKVFSFTEIKLAKKNDIIEVPTGSLISSSGFLGYKYNVVNSNVKFNYVCFKYEVKATKKFSKTLNDRNNDGYDFTTSAIFNKSASFCLMTKPIY